MQVRCHACGLVHAFEGSLSRRQECSGCGADLRCCRNCAFYDPRAYNECREPSAERVLEKDRANFCDYFAASREAATEGRSSHAKDELEKLFKR